MCTISPGDLLNPRFDHARTDIVKRSKTLPGWTLPRFVLTAEACWGHLPLSAPSSPLLVMQAEKQDLEGMGAAGTSL